MSQPLNTQRRAQEPHLPGGGLEPSSTVLTMEGVSKVYRSRTGDVAALRGITLSVARGEFVSIVGRSGCGKSTLLKLVAGVTPSTTGEIFVEGRAVSGPPDGLGMVFQGPVLLDWRDVLGNVLLPIEILGGDRKAGISRARELIGMVGLSEFEHSYPGELSGGMQQRVSICRALVSDPALLLMDEPFGALDALTRDEMATELMRISQRTNKTILFVTHSIDEAVLLSDRVIVMSPRPGTIREIFDIDIAKPRSMDTRYEPEYMAYSRAIRDLIYDK